VTEGGRERGWAEIRAGHVNGLTFSTVIIIFNLSYLANLLSNYRIYSDQFGEVINLFKRYPYIHLCLLSLCFLEAPGGPAGVSEIRRKPSRVASSLLSSLNVGHKFVRKVQER
jgi:hypothetical protein